MQKYLSAAALMCLLATPALAQNSTATGTGVGISSSNSAAGAVAISGAGGRGGNSSLTVNNPANSRTEQVVSGTTTANVNQRVSGTTTIKNVPGALAPGLAAAGLETCLGSVSGGASVVGFGASFGTTVPDPGCAARLDARTLWSMGLKKAAVARLCITPDIYRSMPDVCGQYAPQHAPQGYQVTAAQVVPPVYVGGPIEVIEGKTGRPRMCSDYDNIRQRCRVWVGGAKMVVASAPKPKRPAVTPTGTAASAASASQAAVDQPK